MDRRQLGRTRFLLSPLGFGGFKIGRSEGAKFERSYALPDDAAARAIIRDMIDLGINYIDTAPAYGSSEERVGASFKDQAHIVISTKVGETFAEGRSTFDFSQVAVRASIARSRSRLGRDRLDLVFVHSDGDDLRIMRETDVVAILQELKAAGQVEAIGFSGKTVAGAAAALDWADAIMVEYHPLDESHAPVIADAAARGVGVIVKKGLASGRLSPKNAIPFVLGNPGVTSMVIGTLSVEHMRRNIAIAAAHHAR